MRNRIFAALLAMVCTAAGPTAPATRPSASSGVNVEIFVKSKTWRPQRDTTFAIALHFSCDPGSPYLGRKVEVPDGQNWPENSGSLPLAPAGTSRLAVGDGAVGLPADLRRPGGLVVWFYDYRDATGGRLECLGDESVDEPVPPDPGAAPERVLANGDGAFALVSLDSSHIFRLGASRLVLHAIVLFDSKVVARSNEVDVDILAGK